MELALALNYKTVADLENKMSVEEFNQWFRYSLEKLLPARRMEYYIAQLTLQVSHLGRYWGGPAYSIKDFLFDEREKAATTYDTSESGVAAIGAMVGGIKVIRLGEKRRQREKRKLEGK